MKLSEELEKKLAEYVDGSLSDTEKAAFGRLLEKDPDLKARYDNLNLAERLLKRNRLDIPSRNFTLKVMANLHSKTFQASQSIRRSLFLLAGITMLVVLCGALLASGVFDRAVTTVDLNKINVVKEYFPSSLPSFGLNGKILVNVIVFLNLVIALIVLDRSVLRPLFQRRTGM